MSGVNRRVIYTASALRVTACVSQGEVELIHNLGALTNHFIAIKFAEILEITMGVVQLMVFASVMKLKMKITKG